MKLIVERPRKGEQIVADADRGVGVEVAVEVDVDNPVTKELKLVL